MRLGIVDADDGAAAKIRVAGEIRATIGDGVDTIEVVRGTAIATIIIGDVPAIGVGQLIEPDLVGTAGIVGVLHADGVGAGDAGVVLVFPGQLAKAIVGQENVIKDGAGAGGGILGVGAGRRDGLDHSTDFITAGDLLDSDIGAGAVGGDAVIGRPSLS